MSSAGDNSLFEYLLRLGDSCLILSQRLAEWCGHGPVLEEDIALTNVALDLLGQARLWLSFAGEVEGRGRDEDKLAYLRDAGEFRNFLLVEYPNGDYAQTTARQFYFDVWHRLMLLELEKSQLEPIAAIASKALKEVTYHCERSTDWVIRLGDGTEESHRRMQTAIDSLWTYTGELFTPDPIDSEMISRGVGPDPASLRSSWLEHVRNTLDEATLSCPTEAWAHLGGKRGIHTEHLGYVLAEMQYLQRAYPGAEW